MNHNCYDEEVELCDNCHRAHVDLVWKQWNELSRLQRKTYFLIKHKHSEIALCSLCEVYLKPGTTKTPWPAMVWSFLTTDTNQSSILAVVSLHEKWKYIPSQWRYWWIHAFQNKGITLNDPAPEVFDVTIKHTQLLSALSSLQWRKMVPVMDEFLAFPTVRCPWGCGCYLHETNFLLYEDLLLARSNFGFPSTCSINYNHQKYKWVNSCRPDFPSSTTILENNDFLCQPSLVIKDNLPYVLSCKHHNKASIQRVVHIPMNPTGSLFTEASNQYAPVILKSRTLRKAKFNTYSDTYKTVALQGGYDGMDSAYCVCRGICHSINHLSRQRDYLSLMGRPDMRHHFQMLCHSKDSLTYIPLPNITEMLDAAHYHYPDIDTTLSENLTGATYVPIEDAISMQEASYNLHPLTIIVKDTDEPCIFEPPWPSHMIRVHPFDSYGERFTNIDSPIPQSDPTGFHLWCLMCCYLCVDHIWNQASRSMQTDNDIIGYLMALSWEQRNKDTNRNIKYRPPKYYNLYGTGNHDVDANQEGRIHKKDELVARLQAQNSDDVLSWPTIPKSHSIGTSANYWDPISTEPIYNYIIVTFSHNQDASYKQNKDGSHSLCYRESVVIPNLWEPILIVTKHNDLQLKKSKKVWDGSVYARHGGLKHVGWWTQQYIGSPFRQCATSKFFYVKNLRLIVYRRKHSTYETSIKHRYLAFLGGQTVVFCAEHKFPLILSATKNRKCCCHVNKIGNTQSQCHSDKNNYCNQEARYTCPHSSCLIAICEKDFTFLSATTDKPCYFLSLSSCIPKKNTLLHRNYEVPHYQDSYNDEIDNSDDNNTYISDINNHASLNTTGDQFQISDNDEDEDALQSSVYVNNFFNLDFDSENNFGVEEPHEVITDLLYDDDDSVDTKVDTTDNVDNAPELCNIATHCPLTTAHSEEIMFVDVDMPTEMEKHEEAISIPLHILLNRQGHCLIRKNTKLRPSRRHKSFMQRLVARAKGKCIPLLYGEALLFPDIFFYSTNNGDVLGALPSAFWTDKNTLAKYGIASMRSHAFIRINDPTLITSTDSRYHFLTMDTLINLGLRGNDSRLLLHRGFAETQAKHEGVAIRKEDGTEELYDDNVDNHANIHKLSRLCEQDPPHFFYTQTCNQKTAIGLRILRRWVQSTNATDKIMAKYNITRQEANKILHDSAAPFVQSSWNIFIDIWMNYIINSPEQPLGPIDWAWIRKEFQDKTGNVSHLHVLLKTFIDTSTEKGMKLILDKVRGAVADLIRFKEGRKLIRHGIVESEECLIHLLQDAQKYLMHNCGPRCMIVKKDENGMDVLQCKRIDSWLLSSNPGVHTMQQVFVSHTSSALNILKELNLAEHHPTEGIVITHPLLQMIRHIPKCSKTDPKFSPTNGDLFARYPSSSNLQYVTIQCLSSYLSSYIASVDRVALLYMRPPSNLEPNVMHAQYESLNNTKIKSINRYHEQRLSRKNNYVPIARPVTQMEALTVIKAEPLVSTTIQFIHVPTCPREYRAAVDVSYTKTSNRPQDLQSPFSVIAQIARRRKFFPRHRLFTTHQILVIQDELRSPLNTDKVTHFCMRPPELLFVDNCIDYTQWFERTNVCPIFNSQDSLKFLNNSLNIDEDKSLWLDGFNYQVTVRRAALPVLYKLAKKRINLVHSNNNTNQSRVPSIHTVQLLEKLVWLFEAQQSNVQYVYTRTRLQDIEEISSRFVSQHSKRKLPIVWWAPIPPRRKTAFLVQIIICMGRFITEYEVMLGGSMRGALINAGILDIREPQQSLYNILKKYILHHLRVHATSTMQFDRNLMDAHALLKDIIFQTSTQSPLSGTPSVLYSSIKRDTDIKVTNHIDKCRNIFIDAIYNEIHNCGLLHLVPVKDDVVQARTNPIPEHIVDQFFPPPKHVQQSLDSYKEQKKIMEKIKIAVAMYRSGWKCHRNFVIVGGPGVGKTTVALFSCLYCLSIGLNGITTSLIADRSKELGGIHFHRLIGMRGRTERNSPGKTAEQTLLRMYSHPEIIEFIRRLDFVCLDELGIFSAENLGILDIIFRYIRTNSNFMGGVFVICTMDHLQLLPIHGTPVLLSLYVVTDFTFQRLTKSVRAGNDEALQQIIELTRTIKWNNNKKQRLTELLRKHITFIDTFQDPRIPTDAIYVFSRKEPCKAAEDLMIERMKIIYSGSYITVNSYDEESTTGGNWHIATEGTTRRLDRKIKQRRQLVFYPYAKFEFTQVLKGKFNQGQLALMIDPPTQDIVDNNMPIKVFAAPSGIKNFPPPEECNNNDLLRQGWHVVNVPYDTSSNEQIHSGIQARRTQYLLKPRVSTTIHACMGSTLSSIVCAVVKSPQMPYDFSLWESAQIVVLLSRTKTASSIYFVGDKELTINHIIEVLSGQQYKYLSFISSLLKKLCNESAKHVEIFPQPTKFRTKDSDIPRLPCVYLIVSTKKHDYAYIGTTDNLCRRILEHNSLAGPHITAQPDLLPFAIHAYVIGFNDKQERLRFECQWKIMNNKNKHISSHNNGYITIAIDMIAKINLKKHDQNIPPLRLIQCGYIETTGET